MELIFYQPHTVHLLAIKNGNVEDTEWQLCKIAVMVKQIGKVKEKIYVRC